MQDKCSETIPRSFFVKLLKIKGNYKQTAVKDEGKYVLPLKEEKIQ